MRHRGGKRLPTHQHDHFLGKLRKMHCRLSSGIRAANGIYRFASTGYGFGGPPAVINARALQAFDPGHAQRPPLNAHGEKKRMTLNLEAVGKFQETVRTFRSDADGFLRGEDFHAESPCLGHGATGKIVAAEPGRKPEIILDPGAEPGLAAGSFALDHHCAQTFTGAINGGSKSGGAAPANSEVLVPGLQWPR